MTKLSKYFTLEEMTTTNHKDLDNIPNPIQTLNLKELCTSLLDVIREYYGYPIKVNSGYRSLELNRRVKGAKNSSHLSGKAADITVGSKEKNKILWDCILKLHKVGIIQFDQLINEKDYSWIHVSYNSESSKNRNQILNLP